MNWWSQLSTGQLHLNGFESLILCIKKRPPFRVTAFWQRMRDSNPRKRSQSPVCYRYTNPLFGTFILYAVFQKSQALFAIFQKYFLPGAFPGRSLLIFPRETAFRPGHLPSNSGMSPSRPVLTALQECSAAGAGFPDASDPFPDCFPGK